MTKLVVLGEGTFVKSRVSICLLYTSAGRGAWCTYTATTSPASSSPTPSAPAPTAGAVSYTHLRFEREPEDLAAFMTGDEWEGTNVTIPYERAVMELSLIHI